MEENVTQINGGITINVDASVKDIIYLKKIIFRILLHVIVKMQNIQQVLWMIHQLSAMKSQSKKTKEKTKFNEKKVTCIMKNFNILLAFLLITIALLRAVIIYCYLMKY